MDKTQKRITIKDIAQKCGVTANTVSRVMRNDSGISEATVMKVRKTAEEMGYIRNNLAATMRSGNSRLISIIVDDIQNPHYATLINKMDNRLKKEGYDTMILCTYTSPTESLDMAKLSISHCVDGILYFPDSNSANIADLLKKNHVPVILIDRSINGVEADVVRADDYQGGCLAARHLLSKGHRKFIYIGGPEDNGAQPLRQSGYTDTLIQAGIDPSDINVVKAITAYPIFDPETLSESANHTGIFVFNDELAYGIMNALQSAGYKVPEEVSVIGFDYIRGALPYLLPLTSLGCRQEGLIAEKAVSLLLRRIKEPSSAFVSEILPVILHEPESTVGTVT